MPTLTCGSINSSIRSDGGGLLMAMRIWWGGGLKANSGLQEFPSVPCYRVIPERIKRISGRFHLCLLLLLPFFFFQNSNSENQLLQIFHLSRETESGEKMEGKIKRGRQT